MKWIIFDPTGSEVISLTMKNKSFFVEWEQSQAKDPSSGMLEAKSVSEKKNQGEDPNFVARRTKTLENVYA